MRTITNLLIVETVLGYSRALLFSEHVRKYIYKDAPKRWFTYIDKHLSVLFEEGKLCPMRERSLCLQLNASFLLHVKFFRFVEGLKIHSVYTVQKEGNKDVTTPTGGFQWESQVGDWTPSLSPKFSFVQKGSLQFNSSFAHIYFTQEVDLDTCTSGRLSILETSLPKSIISSLRFCGSHSLLELHLS